MDKEVFSSMTDEEFDEYVAQPIEQNRKIAETNSESIQSLESDAQPEHVRTFEIITNLSNTELVQLAADFREYERNHEIILRGILLEELIKRGLEITGYPE